MCFSKFSVLSKFARLHSLKQTLKKPVIFSNKNVLTEIKFLLFKRGVSSAFDSS
jgi:hypothetical protein